MFLNYKFDRIAQFAFLVGSGVSFNLITSALWLVLPSKFVLVFLLVDIIEQLIILMLFPSFPHLRASRLVQKLIDKEISCLAALSSIYLLVVL